jgi:Predicted membrane protein
MGKEKLSPHRPVGSNPEIISRQPQQPPMAVDPDEGLVTDLMIGLWFVIAADLMALTGFAWVGGYVSRALFVAVTVATNAVFAGWIGWRWHAIRRAQPADRSALEELKQQYAAGELSEQEFEHRLDTLIDTDDAIATTDMDPLHDDTAAADDTTPADDIAAGETTASDDATSADATDGEPARE